MFAERLTMIGHHDDKGAIECACGAQAIEKGSERRVGVCDLAEIRIRNVSGSVRLWRFVRLVGVVEVDPGKVGLRA
jgi:hypothetical protein